VLGAFAPDVSDGVALVATLAMGGMQSGGNGWWLTNRGQCLLLTKGLGIVECVSICDMHVRRWWFAYSGRTECDCTGHIVVDSYVST